MRLKNKKTVKSIVNVSLTKIAMSSKKTRKYEAFEEDEMISLG
jgi:hypothetical protein